MVASLIAIAVTAAAFGGGGYFAARLVLNRRWLAYYAAEAELAKVVDANVRARAVLDKATWDLIGLKLTEWEAEIAKGPVPEARLVALRDAHAARKRALHAKQPDRAPRSSGLPAMTVADTLSNPKEQQAVLSKYATPRDVVGRFDAIVRDVIKDGRE